MNAADLLLHHMWAHPAFPPACNRAKGTTTPRSRRQLMPQMTACDSPWGGCHATTIYVWLSFDEASAGRCVRRELMRSKRGWFRKSACCKLLLDTVVSKIAPCEAPRSVVLTRNNHSAAELGERLRGKLSEAIFFCGYKAV